MFTVNFNGTIKNVVISVLYAYIFSVVLLNFILNNMSTDLERYSNNIMYIDRLELVSKSAYLFYYLQSVIALNIISLYNDDPFDIFQYVIFLSSFLISYSVLNNLKDKKVHFVLYLIISIVLFSPKVIDLIVGNLRGGFAFSIFYFSTQVIHGHKKTFLMILSILIHQSMLPLLAFYLFYHIVKNSKYLNTKPRSFILFLLFIGSLITVYLMKLYHPSEVWQNGTLYTLMIVSLSVIFLVMSKNVLKFEEGFIAVGTMFILLASILQDYNSVRYLAFAPIYFLTFVINRGSVYLVYKFIIMYTPFFLVTLYYWFNNNTNIFN